MSKAMGAQSYFITKSKENKRLLDILISKVKEKRFPEKTAIMIAVDNWIPSSEMSKKEIVEEVVKSWAFGLAVSCASNKAKQSEAQLS